MFFEKIVSYLGSLFLSLLSLLPLRILYLLARAIHFFLYRISGYRLQVVRENLRNSFPEKSDAELLAIEKEYYRYLANLIVEVIKMNTLSPADLKKRFEFKGAQAVEAYLGQGKSVLLCAAHYGNWEWCNMVIGLWFSADNYAIYKPLSNPVFDHWFKRARSRFGNKMIAMRQTLRALTSVTDRPTLFSFGNDQAPARNESQYWTTFLHQESSIQLGIEKIAKKTGRPIFYLNIKPIRRGYYEVVCDPICLEPEKTKPFEITELHTRYLEKMIETVPAYWLWSHRRWKYKPLV
ncbi:MAG: lysophospholipid acyltransferase family protein [Pedobacter sp.]|nr:lysophospholipid acyltransferase family protein [Pedobacter sp.]MDQ8052840.1 lysophospholipid acyltransferase family protein [Pedobacter sp.]